MLFHTPTHFLLFSLPSSLRYLRYALDAGGREVDTTAFTTLVEAGLTAAYSHRNHLLQTSPIFHTHISSFPPSLPPSLPPRYLRYALDAGGREVDTTAFTTLVEAGLTAAYSHRNHLLQTQNVAFADLTAILTSSPPFLLPSLPPSGTFATPSTPADVKSTQPHSPL